MSEQPITTADIRRWFAEGPHGAAVDIEELAVELQELAPDACQDTATSPIQTQEQPATLPACMQAPYAAMLAESARIGWPTAYQRDLTFHDSNYLAQYQPDEFLWILRETGTHLFSPSDGRPLESALQWLRATVNAYGMVNINLYIWCNGKLREAEYEEAREWICRSYPARDRNR